MRTRTRLLALSAAALCLLGGSICSAAQQGADESPLRTLHPQLLEAHTVFLWAGPFATALREHFEKELEIWDRLDCTESREEADVVVILEADYDFVVVPLGDESCDDEVDPSASEPELRKKDPLCGRPEVTELATAAFRVTILVEGGEDLWKDEVAIESDLKAARILVHRLRATMEAAEEEVEPATGL